MTIKNLKILVCNIANASFFLCSEQSLILVVNFAFTFEDFGQQNAVIISISSYYFKLENYFSFEVLKVHCN